MRRRSKKMKKRNVKCGKLLALVSVLALAIGLGILPTRGDAQGQSTLTPQHAILLVAKAIAKADFLLLSNKGIISGQLKHESFTIELQGGGARTVQRNEIHTLDLAFTGRPLDRIVLKDPKDAYKAGQILQGRLQMESFRIELAVGGEVTLPKAALRGVILQMPAPPPRQGPCPRGGCPDPILVQLTANPLVDEITNSLTQHDWIMLKDNRLASGSVLTQSFPFRDPNGQATSIAKESSSLVLFGSQPGRDLLVLKTTGAWLLGTVELKQIRIRLAHQAAQDPGLDIEKDKLYGVFFRVTSQ
jgi:hypothetical protein